MEKTYESKLDIATEHLALVQAILRRYLSPANAKVWVFGSRSKGTAKKFSDLDLAIEMIGLLPSSIETNIAFDFEESDLPYKVDIVDWNAISEAFRERIKADRVLIDF